MIDMFDTLGNILNDAIGSHENNNVGHVVKEMYGYAQGGAVNDLADTTDDNVNLDNPGSIVRALGKAAGPVYGKSGDDSALGKQSSYNSPTFLAKHFTDIGKFFSGAEPGNRYTDRYKNPEQTKPLQSENPTTFYARWYNQNREAAQAEEIANRGQVTVRRT